MGATAINFVLTQCTICGCPHLPYVFEAQGNRASKCADCGLLFLNPRPAALNSSGPSGPTMDALAAQIQLKALLRYVGTSRGKLGILGAGADSFLKLATQAGFESLDPNESDAAWTNLSVCVLYFALEQSKDPVALLARAHQALIPGGTLVVLCPSLDSSMARRQKQRWAEFNAKNLYYFDSQSIQNILAKASFNTVEISPLANGISVLSRAAVIRQRLLLSVVVPVYNEAATFPALIATLAGKEIPGMDKEIILVESHSNDGTREQVLAFQSRPGFKVVLQEKARGKGNAVRAGLAVADGDFVVIQDGDLEYDINDYDQLLEPLASYQRAFVLGSRHSGSWKIRKFSGQPLTSSLLNGAHLFFALLLNLFCGSNLKDPFTMYKVFRRDCLHGLTFKANRFDFDFELIIKLLRKGYRPLEIGVNYRSRSFQEGKKVRIFRDPLTWLVALVRFRFCTLYENRPHA